MIQLKKGCQVAKRCYNTINTSRSLMIKVGTNVKSKIHDDLTGHVVICEPINNYAVIMTDIVDYEMRTVECFLSDLEPLTPFDIKKMEIMKQVREMDYCKN